jgi:hypothetical protein
MDHTKSLEAKTDEKELLESIPSDGDVHPSSLIEGGQAAEPEYRLYRRRFAGVVGFVGTFC